ncbi:MAG: hypothetical protein GKR98_05340 [Boseongicola sp.]|nr:MAG: hypothetical protein GKR98_05340 [Boseongicola sp.]
MLNFRLYMLQRITALVMAPLVLGHLGVMIYAVQGGLSAGEILGRTQGSALWFLFYGMFVLAVSIHGAIGLRVIIFECGGVRGRALDILMWAVGLGLFALGARAVWAVSAARGITSRAHPLWLAYVLHRLSGLALALFLPVHFWVLAMAVSNPAQLDGFLALTDMGVVKLAEFGLVFLLAVHMFGGLRVMALEFLPWSASQKTLAAGAAALSFFVAVLFLLKAV